MGPELNGTPSLQKAQLLIRDGTLPGVLLPRGT
jgi:hypothetical protein